MTYISSQQFLNWDIVEEKKTQLIDAEAAEVIIPFLYVGEIDGVEYAAQCDCHHTMQAAKELGLTINYDVVNDSDGLTGEALLSARHLGDDYYLVETSDPANHQFDLVW